MRFFKSIRTDSAPEHLAATARLNAVTGQRQNREFRSIPTSSDGSVTGRLWKYRAAMR